MYHTIQRAAFAVASQPVQSSRRTSQTTRRVEIALLTSHVRRQMVGQFVSTEKRDLEPENRVYSIKEGAPKGKAVSTHIFRHLQKLGPLVRWN
jgi:signal recognition particle GTPase